MPDELLDAVALVEKEEKSRKQQRYEN